MPKPDNGLQDLYDTTLVQQIQPNGYKQNSKTIVSRPPIYAGSILDIMPDIAADIVTGLLTFSS